MDYIYELLNIAMEKGIGVQLDNNLNPNINSWCKTSLNFIMVNMNYKDKQQIPFQFAHELGHILNGDTSSAKLSFNSHAYNKTEYAAHVTGIKLLVSLYAKKAHELNYVKFMDMFAIPDRMTDVVITELNKKATQY
ncbi:ImmA/IrrE family metallo-endopeptidase [Periweissella fabaria]|uniref:IrrE N-terminal-like domain-containing protein n=1 Tax=Periweissella fabaria TaxID=546157 RepID=A0ABM8Z8G0_9LACO|nr:ImmA/IrrE family metallo-endopeptidase [Periweissella fabaria]MCM0596245.1 ImmA/IrrE family metallo-endopeptidase [Periweissella fabaria]CAH0417503.1 hypothetical protein WFA24289_01845 [Periweissella fabaria]